MFVEHVAMGPPGQCTIVSLRAVRLHGRFHQAIRTETRADGSRRGRDGFLTADSIRRLISPMKGATAAHVESQTSRGSWRTVDQAAVFLHLPRMLAFRSDSGGPAPALAEYRACGTRGAS